MRVNTIDNTTLIFFFTLSALFIGITAGYFLRGFLDKKLRNDNSGRTFVLIVVTVAWVISSIADILIVEYSTNPLLHGLMGAIVGFFYKPKEGGASNDKK